MKVNERNKLKAETRATFLLCKINTIILWTKDNTPQEFLDYIVEGSTYVLVPKHLYKQFLSGFQCFTQPDKNMRKLTCEFNDSYLVVYG